MFARECLYLAGATEGCFYGQDWYLGHWGGGSRGWCGFLGQWAMAISSLGKSGTERALNQTRICRHWQLSAKCQCSAT